MCHTTCLCHFWSQGDWHMDIHWPPYALPWCRYGWPREESAGVGSAEECVFLGRYWVGARWTGPERARNQDFGWSLTQFGLLGSALPILVVQIYVAPFRLLLHHGGGGEGNRFPLSRVAPQPTPDWAKSIHSEYFPNNIISWKSPQFSFLSGSVRGSPQFIV